MLMILTLAGCKLYNKEKLLITFETKPSCKAVITWIEYKLKDVYNFSEVEAIINCFKLVNYVESDLAVNLHLTVKEQKYAGSL